MFFQDWVGLFRVLVASVLGYGSLIAMLRWGGKRVLSKLRAFDLVVTVALGSTLATIILSREVPMAEGVLALFSLVGLQIIVAALSQKYLWFGRLIKSQPTLLYFRGEFLANELAEAQVTRKDILQAVRSNGIPDLAQVSAVVLETNGKFSVVKENEKREVAI